MQENYVYLKADLPIAAKIGYYYDHLKNAREAGFDCLADWIRVLHAKYDGKALKVGEEVGVCYGTILKWFYNLCLPVRPKGGKDEKPHARRHEVGDIYQQTLSGLKTAKELGVSARQVYKWLERDGIPRIGRKGKK